MARSLPLKKTTFIIRSITKMMKLGPTCHSHGYYNEQINIQELVNLQSSRLEEFFWLKLTWKSPSDEAKEYNKVMVVNWIIEYNALWIQRQLPSGVGEKNAPTCT